MGVCEENMFKEEKTDTTAVEEKDVTIDKVDCTSNNYHYCVSEFKFSKDTKYRWNM